MYNSTGGFQKSFLGVYNSYGGIQISFQEFIIPYSRNINPLERYMNPSSGIINPQEGYLNPSSGIKFILFSLLLTFTCFTYTIVTFLIFQHINKQRRIHVFLRPVNICDRVAADFSI